MNAVFSFFNRPYNWQNLGLLVLISFLLRGVVFFSYIQHNERYRQADSMDYHACGVSIGVGYGLVHIEHKKPIFWRTPGYPAYLAFFYNFFGLTDPRFQSNSPAQKAAIWLQILLCSIIPVLSFFLALLLTKSLAIAWIVAWIFVFHLGFILASCYLLTDGLAMPFFLLFLIFFYKSFNFFGEHAQKPKNMLTFVVLASLNLIAYTWLRPNGEFIAFIALIILLFCQCNWQNKLMKMSLFAVVFFAGISPWYVRNHNLTGKWFFCPMSGPYHLAFTAPKIIRRVTKKPLDQCLKYLFWQAKQETKKQEEIMKLVAPDRYVSQELVCKPIALPWITKYPHYFLYDWLKEVCKSTFDLYSSQLVAFCNNTYTFDPIEEFLTEKLKNCIYKQPMSLFMRFICLLELLFSVLIWFGLIGGFIYYLLLPCINSIRKKELLPQTSILWIKTGLMIGGLLFMTGGFGYARLRMPVEALMIILSLTFWFWFLEQQQQKELPQ